MATAIKDRVKPKERGVPAGVLIGGGILGAGLLLFWVTRAKGAPPEPEPGLANLYGKVTDSETGQRISGVSIILNGYPTSTNGSGNYSIRNINLGSYFISLQKEGYQMASFDIVLGEGNNELNVELMPLEVPTANLYGIVTDAETGYALQGVKVTLGSQVVYTDSSGYYSFTNLNPGAYSVKFEKDGYETVTR